MLAHRLRITVEEARAEAAAELLAEQGLAFQQQDQGTLDPPPKGSVWLVVFSPSADAAGARSTVEEALAEAGIPALLDEHEFDDDQFRDAWKVHFKPRPVGPFVLVPSWETYAPAEGETVIDLDPGRAFGTGGHASTRLCLRAIGRIPVGDGVVRRFLDVGSGSGVLAIACARRWPAATGMAIDNDPEAVAVSRENAEHNRVIERIAVAETPLAEIDGAFDVVLANLTAETIIGLAKPLAARVADGGQLIGSGVLAAQADEVVRALVAEGLVVSQIDEETEDAEWRGIVMTRALAPGGA